jgi:hypothetical protein
MFLTAGERLPDQFADEQLAIEAQEERTAEGAP